MHYEPFAGKSSVHFANIGKFMFLSQTITVVI